MIVTGFVGNYIQHNTLIRLWFPVKNGYEEVIKGDKPMMEHELIKTIYADIEVIGITDILYEKSNYIEAVNLVIEL